MVEQMIHNVSIYMVTKGMEWVINKCPAFHRLAKAVFLFRNKQALQKARNPVLTTESGRSTTH